MSVGTTFVGSEPLGRMMPPAVVVAGRLGDAVRWLTGRLLQGSVRVVSLLEGPLSSTDRVLIQDEAAMRALGVQAIRIPRPVDGLMASRTSLDLLVRHLSGAAEVWLPSAIGREPDLLDVRNIGMTIAAESGLPIRLYSDGSPPGTSWNSQSVSEATAFVAADLPHYEALPQLAELSAPALGLKRGALSCYGELQLTEKGMSPELSWRLSRLVRQY